MTGAGRGIGRAIALALATEGVNVVVNDPGVGRDGKGGDIAPAESVAAEIQKAGGTAIPNFESVASFEAAERIIKSCVGKFGSIDILVNCAGIMREGLLVGMSEEDWDLVVTTHLKGTFNCTRHASVLMREQRFGRIVNVASAAWLGGPGISSYSAAKGGIVSFTWTIAGELGRYGVTCNAIAPSAATRMTAEMRAGWQKIYDLGLINKERYEHLMNMQGPEHIAPMVLYLASDRAADINGLVFQVEAGKISLYSQPQEIKTVYRNYQKYGKWTWLELVESIPNTLLTGYVNPAPQETAPK